MYNPKHIVKIFFINEKITFNESSDKIFNEKLSDNKIKDVLKILRESNYNDDLLFAIVNHYYKNNYMNNIHNDIIYKIKNEYVIGIIYYIIAIYYENDKKLDDMARYLLLSSDYKNSTALTRLGLYYVHKLDFIKAEVFFNLGAELDNYYCVNNIIALYYFLEKYKELKLFLTNKENRFYNIKHQLGLYYNFIEKNDMLVKKYYSESIELYNYVNSMHNLGIYYENNKDYDNMIKYYLMAIEKNNTNSMYHLVLYYEQTHNYEEMISLCNKMLKFNNSHNAYFLLGNYYLSIKNDYVNAILCFENLVKLQYYEFYYDIIYIYFLQKDFNNAIKVINLAKKEKLLLFHFYLALYYDQMNNFDKAIKEIKILMGKKENPFSHLYLAKYYLFNKIDINLCKFHINKFTESNYNHNILIKLENLFSKEVLNNLFALSNTKIT